ERFGPSKADYQSLIAFLTAHGFSITDTFANRLLVDVEASVADIEKTFHLELRLYPHPNEGRDFFAPDVEPSLDLSVPILHITGLNDFQLPRPASLRITEPPVGGPPRGGTPQPQAGSGPGGSYKGVDFRAAYAPGVLLTGAGQYVGLLQFD